MASARETQAAASVVRLTEQLMATASVEGLMEAHRRLAGVANAFDSFAGADSLMERHTLLSRMLVARVDTPPVPLEKHARRRVDVSVR